MTQKPKFMRLVRDRIRTMQYSYFTEKSYVFWIKRFIHFHSLRHPKDMSSGEVNQFLSYLAVHRKVAPSTQNQALCALVFLYKQVLNCPLGENTVNAVRSKIHRNLPVVLSLVEVKQLLSVMHGLPQVMAKLIYGTGLRKTEVHRLRVKDIDFDRNQVIVKRGKGKKDRPLPLPVACREDLFKQIEFVKQLHLKDRRENINGVELPYALERKEPNAGNCSPGNGYSPAFELVLIRAHWLSEDTMFTHLFLQNTLKTR